LGSFRRRPHAVYMPRKYPHLKLLLEIVDAASDPIDRNTKMFGR
jgi:hypothetical protein